MAIPSMSVRSGDTVVSNGDSAGVITLAALPGARHVIGQIIASYDKAPTSGEVTITDGGVTVFQIDVTVEGVQEIDFMPAKKFSENSEVIITIVAGGSSVVGKLNITRWAE